MKTNTMSTITMSTNTMYHERQKVSEITVKMVDRGT